MNKLFNTHRHLHIAKYRPAPFVLPRAAIQRAKSAGCLLLRQIVRIIKPPGATRRIATNLADAQIALPEAARP